MNIRIREMIFVVFMFCLYSCSTQVDVKPPTEKEIELGIKKFVDIREKLNTELRIIEDLETGIEKAKIEQKGIALMFTGYGAVNSRKLEHEIIVGDNEVFSILKGKYINVWLYVDERQKIEDGKETNNKYKTLGEKWKDLQTNEFQSNILPHIFILDSNGNKIDGGIGYNESKEKLLPLLKKHIK